MKKIVITVVVLIVVAFIGYKGKSLLNERKKEVQETPLPMTQYVNIKLTKAKESEAQQSIPLLAEVSAQKSIKLSTKLAGFVKEVLVKEAQTVKKGDILVRIDDADIKSNLASLKSNLSTQKADLEVAKKIYNRNLKLYKVGALPKEKLELSSLSLKAKSSTIEATKQKIIQLQNSLNYLNIKAPFDAQVDSILLHQGDLAAAGKPIIVLSNSDKKLLISYPVNTPIKVGDSVYKSGKALGKIRAIYDVAKNGLKIAEVALNKPLNYPVGSSLNVDVLVAKAKGCTLPQEAILHTSKGNFVLEYANSKFSKVKVETILENSSVAVLKSCPKNPVAVGNETTLASLQAYKNVKVIGAQNAQ